MVAVPNERSTALRRGVLVTVRLRLKRTGRRHQPSFRLAAIDGRRPRDGMVLEELGQYDPRARTPERQVLLNRDRVEYWLGVGAQPSDTVRQLLKTQGIATGGSKKK
jgi:small subunit ribosomal protein S16